MTPDPDIDPHVDASAPKRSTQRYINGGRGRWKHCRSGRRFR